ncbi:DUF982 domain-containing protein [Mesorhizobium sp. SP-1A]|uniref:DUF982 domain-containing protein n=1 Tax=Mesorhizobium sp. SP-1A TaxID=3077840 RepID=UPI0028F7453E|nr:DUF982 domain-containing protein [Mesorhizobium sp. SP-1A]
MNSLQFEVPVRVALGPGQPIEEIYGVEMALDLLADWPVGRQGPLYQAAFNACFGVSVGVVQAEEACRAFAAFCRVSNILAKDMMPPETGKGPEAGQGYLI